MTTASPLQDASEPAGHMDDRLLFWVTQGLFFGIATTGLFVLKAAVLDRLIGPELASRTILVRLAILVIDVILLAAMPHFLFNALSAVLACRHDPEAVEAVTTALADYLRFCLLPPWWPGALGA
jgi:hypothetical protein